MANTVSFIIELKNRFSKTSRQISNSFDKIKKSATETDQKLKTMFDGFQSRAKQFAGSAAKAGGVMTAAVTTPIVLMGKKMVDAASDAEETANKFKEVFKGIESQSALTELTGSYNLATSSAQELLSNTGDLLVGLGLSREQALKLSGDVVKLSADVASFKNVQGGTARASTALTKALLGEREMLKETFKTAVLEADVKERAMQLRRRDRTLTEKQAKDKGYDIKVGKFPFSASGKASAAGNKDGFVKVIFDAKYGEWLGCHMIGAGVTDMIAEAVLGRKLETTGHEVLKAVHPHPTMSEAVMEAVADAYDEVIHL